MNKTPAADRRRIRSANRGVALQLQLDACRRDGDISAMVIADADGLPLATSGDDAACEEVAARVVLVGRKISNFAGTLLGAGATWDVHMTKVTVGNDELLVCAVGGRAEQRQRQVVRSATVAKRILQAA